MEAPAVLAVKVMIAPETPAVTEASESLLMAVAKPEAIVMVVESWP